MAYFTLRPSRPTTFVAASAALLIFQACGDDGSEPMADAMTDTDPVMDACGGHGELHGDHCDCDDGYDRDGSDETLCVEESTDSEPSYKPGRLLVAEGSEGGVVVIDLAQGELIERLETMAPARLYPSSSGARGYAVQGTANAVQGIDPGLRHIDHGDHFDRDETDPNVFSEVAVSCERPVHFVSHDGESAAFCDGDGMLHIFEDERADFDVTSYDSGRPHHGVGLVAFEHILLSKPNPDDEEDSLPVGVRVLDREGTEIASFDACPGLHGEATTEDHVCFGCTNGVMCIGASSTAGEFEMVKIHNPEDSEEGVRVGTLAGGRAFLIGNFDEDLVRVDAETGTMEVIAVGEAYLGFQLSHDHDALLLLTDAGELRRIHLDDGDMEATTEVFPAFEREAGHGQLRPVFAVGPDHVYVVDPRHSEVYEFDAKTLQLTPRMMTLPEGQYSSLALVALEPEEAH